MKVYLIREKNNINATAEFDPNPKAVTVCKGSTLSVSITRTGKFRGAKSIDERRKGVMKDNILQKDVTFKSASSAANFVTGSSTNGLITWKDKDGRTIKEILSKAEV